MGKNSPSRVRHRHLVNMINIARYYYLGPLIGPKEKHQHDYRWDPQGLEVSVPLDCIAADLRLDEPD